MSILAAIIMGIVQGLTEFLPVSSSAHLVFADHFLHIHLSEAQTVSFDVLLHLGTLVAVFVYFRKDILELLRGAGQLLARPQRAWQENPHSRVFAMLLLGTIPAGIAGITLKDFFQGAFQSVPGTASLLFITAAMLIWITRRKTGERDMTSINWKDALTIGAFQAFAILPGVSRSGSTITGGLLRGLDRDAAPRFSFLLSVPIILAGGLFDLKDTLESGQFLPVPLLVAGFVAAAISGYAAVVLLLNIVRRGRLDRFAYYCVAAGAFVIAYWFLLVPQVNAQTITAVADGKKLVVSQEGELGPVEFGRPLLLQVPAGTPPLRDVIIYAAGVEHTATVQQVSAQGHPGEGTNLYLVELNLPALFGATYQPGPGGETQDIWVILRSKLGIRNEVRVRLHVMPEAPLKRMA